MISINLTIHENHNLILTRNCSCPTRQSKCKAQNHIQTRLKRGTIFHSWIRLISVYDYDTLNYHVIVLRAESKKLQNFPLPRANPVGEGGADVQHGRSSAKMHVKTKEQGPCCLGVSGSAPWICH